MHCLIVGKTLSGKTTFAKKKAASLKKQGIKIIVLDPFLDPDWHADYITGNADKFLDVVWNKSQGCAIFVDEGGKMIGRYNPIMEELATHGRHWGHKCFFITQRCKQVSVNIRTQCSDLVVFKQSLNDTKELADEFVEPMINEAHTLSKGEFIYVRDGRDTVKLNVFDI